MVGANGDAARPQILNIVIINYYHEYINHYIFNNDDDTVQTLLTRIRRF